MKLRNVQIGDVNAYVAMRCDPVMMADLGGPLDPADMLRQVRRDVAETEANREWILMILAADDDHASVAGTVTLSREPGSETSSEMGWAVLPAYQGEDLPRRPCKP